MADSEQHVPMIYASHYVYWMYVLNCIHVFNMHNMHTVNALDDSAPTQGSRLAIQASRQGRAGCDDQPSDTL